MGVESPLIEVEVSSVVSCDDIMDSSLLEMNDIWNIHNMNIRCLRSFMNSELEIFFCFPSRLQDISDTGYVTLAVKHNLILGVLGKKMGLPTCSPLLWS